MQKDRLIEPTLHATSALGFLLGIDLTLAAKEKAGDPIAPPGLPLPDAGRLAPITDDCVRV